MTLDRTVPCPCGCGLPVPVPRLYPDDERPKAAAWLLFSLLAAVALVAAVLIGYELLADTGWSS